MRSRPARTDSGFTLVELLIVMVVMPLVVAAIAVAIITTEKNAGTTKARLTDSANAQISSEYFVPDVQSAQLVTLPAPNTKLPNSSIVPTTTIPPVCGSGTAFLLGIYRSIGATTGVSVGYWVTTPPVGPATLTRYACTVTPAPGTGVLTAGSPTRALISDDITPASQIPATITPSQFATAAGLGWTAVTTSATVTTTTPILASPTPFSLPVNPTTNGFNLSQQISVMTSVGYQPITCTGATVSAFTGCSSTSGSQLTAGAGSLATQPASVSGVNLSVFEPGSAYSYRLTAVPRSYAVVGSSGVGGAGVGAPALLTLGKSGNTINGGSGAQLTVNGNVAINEGTLTCTGTPLPVVTAWGYGAESGTSAFSPSSCATGGPTTTQPDVPDPYASVLPAYPAQFPAEPVISSIPGSGNCTPGEYTVAFTCSRLTPGVYVLDRGLGGRSIRMATGTPAGQGVLLYLPCKGSCTASINATASNQTLNLPGLSASQAGSYFGTTALQGIVIWQDENDAAPATVGGAGSHIALGGKVYLPGAGLSIRAVGSSGSFSLGGLVGLTITMATGASATIQP